MRVSLGQWYLDVLIVLLAALLVEFLVSTAGVIHTVSGDEWSHGIVPLGLPARWFLSWRDPVTIYTKSIRPAYVVSCNLPLDTQFSIPYNRSNTRLLSLLKLWHNHALAVMWCVNWYKMIKSAFPVTYRYLELMVLNNKLTRESIPTKTLHPWMKKQSRGSNQHAFLVNIMIQPNLANDSVLNKSLRISLHGVFWVQC